MVLLSLLAEVHPRENIIALHINHLLRGEESNLDEALVYKVTSLLGIKCIGIRADITTLATTEKLSIEAAGRKIRRDFFEKSAHEFGAAGIFLAHHKNDQAETILRNFIKGSRLRGLSGMSESDGLYFRPLLSATKSEIIAFAKENEIVWREDASNTDSSFERNLVRNDIFPLAAGLNPEVIATIAGFGEFARKAGNFFEKLLEDPISRKEISTELFASYPEILRESFIEQTYAKAHRGSTIGLSAGNIAEISRFILEANGGTKKEIGKLALIKKKGIVSWE